MKKTLSLICCTLLLVSVVAVFATQPETVTAIRTAFHMLVCGEEVSAPEMVVINDRTYVPLRAMGDLLGVDVDWDEETRTVLIENDKAPGENNYTDQFKMNDGIAEEIARIAVKYALSDSILEGAFPVIMQVEDEYHVAFVREDVSGYLLVRIGLDGSVISISAEEETQKEG